jgi:hypothetical protein
MIVDMPTLREDFYDPNYPFRIAHHKLQTLDTVRIIEGTT